MVSPNGHPMFTGPFDQPLFALSRCGKVWSGPRPSNVAAFPHVKCGCPYPTSGQRQGPRHVESWEHGVRPHVIQRTANHFRWVPNSTILPKQQTRESVQDLDLSSLYPPPFTPHRPPAPFSLCRCPVPCDKRAKSD